MKMIPDQGQSYRVKKLSKYIVKLLTNYNGQHIMELKISFMQIERN